MDSTLSKNFFQIPLTFFACRQKSFFFSVSFAMSQWKHGLAPGVSDMIDEAVRNNTIPFAQSSRLCNICFELLDMSHVSLNVKVCEKCTLQFASGLKRKRE